MIDLRPLRHPKVLSVLPRVKYIYIYMSLLYNIEDHRIPIVRASEVSHWDAVKYCDLD